MVCCLYMYPPVYKIGEFEKPTNIKMPENIRALWGLSNNSRSDKTRPSYVLPYKHLARLVEGVFNT